MSRKAICWWGAFFVLAGLAALAGLAHLGKSIGGMSGSFAARDGDPVLTAEAAKLRPVIRALNRYYRKHGSLPKALGEVEPNPPAPAEVLMRCSYDPGQDGGRYQIRYKLGWDPSLIYEYDGKSGQWSFDPGDGGSEPKRIELAP